MSIFSIFAKAKVIEPELARLSDRFVERVFANVGIPATEKIALGTRVSDFSHQYVELWKARGSVGIAQAGEEYHLAPGLLREDNPLLQGTLGLESGFHARRLLAHPHLGYDVPYARLVDASRNIADDAAIGLLRWKNGGTETRILGITIKRPNREFDHRILGQMQRSSKNMLSEHVGNLETFCQQHFPELVKEASVEQDAAVILKNDWAATHGKEASAGKMSNLGK